MSTPSSVTGTSAKDCKYTTRESTVSVVMSRLNERTCSSTLGKAGTRQRGKER